MKRKVFLRISYRSEQTPRVLNLCTAYIRTIPPVTTAIAKGRLISLFPPAAAELTSLLENDGFSVMSYPRTTGDGYYESAVEDPEGNAVEITV